MLIATIMLKNFPKIGYNAAFNRFKVNIETNNFLTKANGAPKTQQTFQLNTRNQLKNSRKLLSEYSTCIEVHKRYLYSNSEIKSVNVVSKYANMEKNLKWRANPVITVLDTPEFKSILTKNILDLVAIFTKYNYEIRIAGGAVRLENSFSCNFIFIGQIL